jgi:hypothetical protein
MLTLGVSGIALLTIALLTGLALVHRSRRIKRERYLDRLGAALKYDLKARL